LVTTPEPPAGGLGALAVDVKLAISGKGGVGKTTLSAMLAGALALKGRTVIAIDADPDSNLGSALGLGDEEITPLAEMSDLIEQRTGSPKGYGGYFKLNPRVDDIPDDYARQLGNIRLLVLGGVKAGGDGCICPATALLKALLIHLVLGRDDCLIMDMEAGIEHLGRATAQSMDALLVVVDDTAWSAQTAGRVRKLAADLGMRNVFAVANRTAGDAELDEVRRRLGEVPLVGALPQDDRLRAGVLRATPQDGVEPREALTANLPNVEKILSELESRL
jgi:CO dehydrogenase maturation factor